MSTFKLMVMGYCLDCGDKLWKKGWSEGVPWKECLICGFKSEQEYFTHRDRQLFHAYSVFKVGKTHPVHP